MRIPLVELAGQYRMLRDEILPAMDGVMTEAQFILGEDVARFEEEFAAFCGAKHCVGVASGLDALQLALRAVGVGPGDEVITAANTFIASALAVTHTGATPVLADVREDDFNLDPEAVERAITPRTRAILPVHLYGQPARMDEIMDIARRHGLRVVEDACQAHGARYGAARAGAMGDAGCFSFYPGKNLGGYGDGGAVVTDDPGIAERLRLDRNYGSRIKYVHDSAGFNSRLDTLQAAVLRIKLRRLDGWNARRRELAALYRELLADAGVLLPQEMRGVEHVWHLFVVRHPERDRLMAELHARGIGAGVHYPIPIHEQAPYAGIRTVPESAPVSTMLSRQILSLPLYPEMTEAQVAEVAAAVRACAAARTPALAVAA
ncbi:MAG TPA: DegT/DnrJ/EryC1/StrS family aminotransferase [Longimicrobium sp.]|nr:DegT/DnrJ/EryC1/StrS family aminotransferase [Longimicrobium sp.]